MRQIGDVDSQAHPTKFESASSNSRTYKQLTILYPTTSQINTMAAYTNLSANSNQLFSVSWIAFSRKYLTTNTNKIVAITAQPKQYTVNTILTAATGHKPPNHYHDKETTCGKFNRPIKSKKHTRKISTQCANTKTNRKTK